MQGPTPQDRMAEFDARLSRIEGIVEQLARAGIPTFEVSNFWRKISEISDDKYNRTHPTNAERFINIMAIDQEIEKKRKEDQPLFPNK